MHVFQKGIRGDDPFGPDTRAQDCGIVANPDAQPLPLEREPAADPIDQLALTGHQYSCPKPVCVVP